MDEQKLECPKCGLKIGLPDESKDIVKKTMRKFEELKRNSLK